MSIFIFFLKIRKSKSFVMEKFTDIDLKGGLVSIGRRMGLGLDGLHYEINGMENGMGTKMVT